VCSTVSPPELRGQHSGARKCSKGAACQRYECEKLHPDDRRPLCCADCEDYSCNGTAIHRHRSATHHQMAETSAWAEGLHTSEWWARRKAIIAEVSHCQPPVPACAYNLAQPLRHIPQERKERQRRWEEEQKRRKQEYEERQERRRVGGAIISERGL
jgi:hypothetical protein